MKITNEEKELMKFISNPSYREKIILKVHKERNAKYNKNIKSVEKDINRLTKERADEITRISNARWESVVKDKFLINRTEGAVKLNQSYVLFSSIKGAEINMQQAFRTVTTDNTKSKKHASAGGALLGGALLGPIGAMAGGVGLGKTKTKGQSVSNQIPTCTHLGVLVNVDGFISEISLLETQVDQSSTIFANTYNLAQKIVTQLGLLSKTPVPNSYLKPEEECTVKNIENQICDKQAELQKVIDNKPTYELPDIYRSKEQKEMSDEEYLKYLKEKDLLRDEEISRNKEFVKQKKQRLKELKQKENPKKHHSAPVSININFSKTLSVIGDVIFWILSIFSLLFSIVGFATSGGVVCGIILMLTAILINPIIYGILKNKFYKLNHWICIAIFIVGFIGGVLMFPS